MATHFILSAWPGKGQEGSGLCPRRVEGWPGTRKGVGGQETAGLTSLVEAVSPLSTHFSPEIIEGVRLIVSMHPAYY